MQPISDVARAMAAKIAEARFTQELSRAQSVEEMKEIAGRYVEHFPEADKPRMREVYARWLERHKAKAQQ